MTIVLYIIIGVAAGFMGGFAGIGGGTIMIPLLIYLFGLSQHQAQGTTLAVMVPPIGLLAAWVYYKKGYVNIPMALFICLGFVIGGFLGATVATGLPNHVLRKLFGVFLLFVSLQLLLTK